MMLRKMVQTRWMLVLLLGVGLVSAGCDIFAPAPAPAPAPEPECTVDADCPDGQVCNNGVCEAAPVVCVEAGGACDLLGALCCEGLTCVDGTCVEETPEPECTVDADCPEGQVCEEGQCVDEPIVGGPCTVQGADPEAGGTAYAASCVACHGEDASGPTSLLETEDITGAMQDRFSGGADHMGATLTDDEIRDITCWVWQQ